MGTFSNNSLHIIPKSTIRKTIKKYISYQNDQKKIFPPACAAQSIVQPGWVGLIGLNGLSSNQRTAIDQLVANVELYDALHPLGETRQYQGTVREYLQREKNRINFECRKRKLTPIDVDLLSDDQCVDTFLELRSAGFFKNAPTLNGYHVVLDYRSIIAERMILTWHANDPVTQDLAIRMIREFFDHSLLRDHYGLAIVHWSTDAAHSHVLCCNASRDGRRKLGLNATDRDELRRHWDRICVKYGCSIIADRHLCSPKTDAGAVHGEFVRQVRAQNLVPVYDNLDYSIVERELSRGEWREEKKRYSLGESERQDLLYFGPQQVLDENLLETDYGVPIYDNNLNHIPENFLFLQWLDFVMRSEFTFLHKNREKLYISRKQMLEYLDKIAETNRIRDVIVKYNVREMVHVVDCIEKLQKLMDDHAFQDDGERIETQLQLLKMFVKIWENPMLLMRDLLECSKNARLEKNPSLDARMACAAEKLSDKTPKFRPQKTRPQERER